MIIYIWTCHAVPWQWQRGDFLQLDILCKNFHTKTKFLSTKQYVHIKICTYTNVLVDS